MNLNDGGVHYDFGQIRNKGIETCAQEFSEGHDTLKNILLELWQRGLSTYACCKGVSEPGHKTGPFKNPYVAILVEPENQQAALELFEKVLLCKDKNKPDAEFSCDIIDEKLRVSLVLSRDGLISNGTCNKMFDCLLNCIENEKPDITPSPEIADAIEFAQGLAHRIPANPLRCVGVKVDSHVTVSTRDRFAKQRWSKLEKSDLELLTTEPYPMERIASNINERETEV